MFVIRLVHLFHSPTKEIKELNDENIIIIFIHLFVYFIHKKSQKYKSFMSQTKYNQNHTQSTVPWIEKYRPQSFQHIVLDPMNRRLFQNILDKRYFPNLLFYGIPGTGKTTTVINLINEYQERYSKGVKGSVIHLNASDERGIDIIRNHINQFVKSKNMFDETGGCKFVILDEVDYMTKNAQQALKYLIQTTTYNVHYCLICNYISKIDEQLQNEFICVRFNQLPKQDIHNFIKKISIMENIGLTDDIIETVLDIHNSDIRSIINFIQLNQNLSQPSSQPSLELSSPENNGQPPPPPTETNWCNNIVNNKIWETLHNMLYETNVLLLSSSSELTENKIIFNIIHYINDISVKYNMDKKNILQTYFNYVIRNYGSSVISPSFIQLIENIIHCGDTKNDIVVNYFSFFVRKYYNTIRNGSGNGNENKTANTVPTVK